METATGILLRKIRFSDTSLIVTWLTPNHGKIKTLAKGALRPKSSFAGAMDLFFECEISFARSARSEIHALRECVALSSREGIRREYLRVMLASYFVELLDFLIELEHPSDELFDLLSRGLNYLDETPANRRALLHYEKELARILGIQNPGVTPISAIGHASHHIPASRVSLFATLPA